MTILCLTSGALSKLLAWRNPEGREQGWMDETQVRPLTYIDVLRVAVTEIALPIFATAAVIETGLYGLLAVVSLALYPITDQPHRVFTKLLESSSFTILWAVSDIIANLFFRNVLTIEAYARRYADGLAIIRFCRPEDRALLQALEDLRL